jgi:hypothetical protein
MATTFEWEQERRRRRRGAAVVLEKGSANGHGPLGFILRRALMIHPWVLFLLISFLISSLNLFYSATTMEAIDHRGTAIKKESKVAQLTRRRIKVAQRTKRRILTIPASNATDQKALINEFSTPPLGPLVTAPTFDNDDQKSNSKYQEIEAMCTLTRYTHLFGMFCDPVDRFSCDLDAFNAYFKNHSAKENLVAGCPLAEAVCYANRYPDLFTGYCRRTGKCDYYALRDHYEQNGMKERRTWGCDLQPIQLASMVTRQQPAVTVDDKLPVSTKRQNVLGKASLQVFQGSWEPVEYNQENVPSESICPEMTKSANRFCNFTARPDYKPATYVANGWPKKWSAHRFKEAMSKHGDRIGFVGDSLMLQLKHELECLASADGVFIPNLNFYQVFMASLPDSIHERFEVRGSIFDDLRNQTFGLEWVHQAIKDKVTYVVYNTGAWWNPKTFWVRGNWCDYNDWRQSTQEELLHIYMETMEQTMLPIFTSLVRDHGIIPIWMDTAPGGKMNLTTGENYDLNQHAHYYTLFPRFNEVGRSMMVRAGGLILPTWDVSFPRSMDHMFADNPKENDQLHWCAQQRRSVPAVWAQLLSQVLYGNDDDEEINTTATNNSTESYNEYKKLFQHGRGDMDEVTSRRRAQAFNVRGGRSSQQGDSQGSSTSNEYVAVPLSRSIESPCDCGRAKDKIQCRANIRCSWKIGAHESSSEAAGFCSEAV